jgi:hypothetical protein
MTRRNPAGTEALPDCSDVGLNAWLRWWWADAAAGLVIAALAVREGLEAWGEAG